VAYAYEQCSEPKTSKFVGMSELVEEDDYENEPVLLASHDSHWRSIYAVEATRLRSVVAPGVIAHAGVRLTSRRS
jgi:hypothetical protein